MMGFSWFNGRKKKRVVNNGNTSSAGDSNLSNSSSVKVASNAKANVSFHIASTRRPQDEYKILVNNNNRRLNMFGCREARMDPR